LECAVAQRAWVWGKRRAFQLMRRWAADGCWVNVLRGRACGTFPPPQWTRAMILRAAARPPAPTSIDIPSRRTIMDESHLTWLYQLAAVMAQVWYYVSQRYGANVFDAPVIRCRLVRGRRRAHSLARRWALEMVELGAPAAWAEAYWTRVDIIRPLL